jgi:hypothetical protein
MSAQKKLRHIVLMLKAWLISYGDIKFNYRLGNPEKSGKMHLDGEEHTTYGRTKCDCYTGCAGCSDDFSHFA